jgi:glycosyltransferase involved in cell wall biosynthesis
MNVLQMCRALSDLGFKVHLATYPLGKTESVPGLVYHRGPRLPFIHKVPIGFSLSKVFLDLSLAARVIGLMLTRRFLAVHAVEEAAFFCAPLGHLMGTPVISDIDSNIPEQLASHPSAVAGLLVSPARWVQRWSLGPSACALTVCQSLTSHVQSLSPGKPVFQIEDVPLSSTDRPADAGKVERMRRDLGLDGRRVILYAGNLEPYQGMDLMLEALPGVQESFPDAALVVIGGEDDQLALMREQGRSLQVSDSLHLLGKKDPDLLPEFMDLADVLVSPRREGENTPFKIYGYMLSGKPIVATDARTHTQVLDETVAILTPTTATGLAQGVVRALSEPDEAVRLANLARARARDEYNFESFRQKISEVYRFIEGGRRPSSEPKR